jgi:hypothetical protein
MSKDVLFNGGGTLRDRLQTLGPGLVSQFRVHGDFAQTRTWQHDGDVEVEFQGLHAMVLVGYRKVDNGDYRYLLQNWWAEKPYVEVDLQYLTSSRATARFIVEEQKDTGSYECTMDVLVESNVDARECYPMERMERACQRAF